MFLFLFLHHTLNLPSLRSRYASKSYSVAILATLLWAINPVQTQAVTFIVQRMTSLAGMFYIMSMYFYVKARKEGVRVRRAVFFIFCFFSFFMAFGSKENAIMLPLSLLLYETLIVQEERGKFLATNIRVLFMVVGATLLAGLISLYWKDGAILSFLSGYGNRPFSITQRLLTEPRIIIFYITLLLYPVPHRLSIAHSIEISTSLFSPITTFISIVLILGVIAYFILIAKRHPLFSFCLFFFFLNHMVESTIFPLDLIFEHRNYVPSMMFFVPIAIGFCKLLELYETKKRMKHIISAFIVFLVIGFGHSTFIRNFVWKTPGSLWMDAVEKAPDQLRVHHNLGLYYQGRGSRQQAINEYEKALSSPFINRKTEPIVTYYQLGRLYGELKNYEKAKSFYQKAIHMKPSFSSALVNLASIYEKEGNRTLADQYLLKAFKANNGSALVNLNMGIYCLRNGMVEEAIHHLQRAMKAKRLEGRALLYLGIAYKQKGWSGRAVVSLRQAIALDPRNLTPRLHLAEIFISTGNEVECRREVETVVHQMIQDENLFGQIMSLISKGESDMDFQLSGNLLIPMIARALDERSTKLNDLNQSVKQIMERGMEIK
jgi:Tfp pilus assembly protein PilF